MSESNLSARFRELRVCIDAAAADYSDSIPLDLEESVSEPVKTDHITIQIGFDTSPFINDMSVITGFFSNESLPETLKPIGDRLFDFLQLLISGKHGGLIINLPAAADTDNHIVRLGIGGNLELLAAAIRAGKIDSYIGHDFLPSVD